ncbi:putative baseplate assembly protein [Haloarcula sp. 1CSR25-25]|uniref:putative baseplate assembly protein n=1 Tax=Haloarcula sp. 1CSR25-25 TaxID=2862545 RepID=UPI00289510B0|nr:putative baseplate assembly protein [Haloarcula sp. 1CSR25-25]MDT3435976.1 putative baseplate assembly protein [Haloarcula sp. 1CSR25-25]
MGIDVPTLDDRPYEELLEDVRKRIPVYDEEWTDHNAHDPGITVLELLTWLSETYRYQLDQVEERHRRKYVQLLGDIAEPVAATAAVRVEPSDSVAGETVAEGTRLVADDGGTERLFRTARETPLTRASVAKVLTETPAGRTDHTPAAESEETYFHAFGEHGTAGSALYLGFDADPFENPRTPLALTVDYHDASLPPRADHGGEAGTFEPSVAVAWEYCTDYRSWERASAWEPFEFSDTTAALYGDGVVTLAHPGLDRWQGVDRHAPGVLESGRGYAWVRARLTSPGYEIPPQLNRVRTNVLSVTHRAEMSDERLTRADGGERTTARPHQRFAFEHAPVLDVDLRVGGEPWDEVDDFDAAGPDATVYVLDETAGTVQFGDNIHGAVPSADQFVEAASYTAGGGPEGNVPATSDWWFARRDATESAQDWVADPAVRDATVVGTDAGTGGRPAESVDDALARLQGDLRVPYRATTAEDCEYVALHTPGLRFGRAAAVVTDDSSPGSCPDHDAVRVVVVPYSPPAIDRLTPSEGFLDAVQCHLERHRLVTDRVTAIPPTYVGIGVHATVELEPGTVASNRRAAVVERLDEFLSPLRGFGGDGWPFGRPVYDSELYEVVGDVPGVDCVVDMEVSHDGGGTATAEAVEIPDTALVAPTDHTVDTRDGGRDCGEVGR